MSRIVSCGQVGQVSLEVENEDHETQVKHSPLR